MGWGGKKGGEGERAGIFLLGQLPGLFHQREGSPRRRATGFQELLAANPGPHGSVYPGTGEPINCSPEPARGARFSSTLQPRQQGWDSLPGAGRGTTAWARLSSPAGAWPPCSCALGKVSPSPHPQSWQSALLLPSALQGHAQSPHSIPGVAEGHQGTGVLRCHVSYSWT